MGTLEELKKDLTNNTKEASYFLWSSLIAVNSLLATVLVAIAAFKDLSQTSKGIIFTGFILSTAACILMLSNFANSKKLYIRIFKRVDSGGVLTKETQLDDLNVANKFNKQSSEHENFAYIASLLAWIILVIILSDLML